MGERRGTKALELWCRRITEGYHGVNVQNMTTSWRDGLAFCAMIHHFRPDLIDFDSLNKDDVYGNNELAFRIAEQHLGIPALLDAEDMASCAVPDRLSILTYLSQFYQTFGGSSPSRLALNRTTENASERIAPVPESSKPKMGSRLGMRRDPCAVCGLPVFLAEKLVVSRTFYHRTCFRCARCKNQLTPGNYYETEDGQYCCETCPDEESRSVPTMHKSYNESILHSSKDSQVQSSEDVYQKPLSDEEKSEKFGLSIPKDTRSPPPSEDISPTSEITSHTQQMRLNFMESHLLSEKLNELSVVDESETLSQSSASNNSEESLDDHSAFPNSFPPTSLKREEFDVKSDPVNTLEVDSRSFGNQRFTAISSHDVDNKSLDLKENTKDLLGEAASNTPSLVQQRLKMFEGQENNGLRTCRNDFVKAAVFKKNLEKIEQDRKKESFQSENIESREDFKLKEIFESRDSFKISDDVAENCETVEPLSPTDKGITAAEVLKKVIDDMDPQLSSITTECNLFTAKGINLSDLEEYPETLNPFADEDEQNKKDQGNSSQISTNPFDIEDENPSVAVPSPQPATRGTVAERNKTEQAPVKRRLQAPHINLNPFLSDDDDSDTEDRKKTDGPVPKPRTMKQIEVALLSSNANLERSGIYASNTSLGSCGSTTTPGGTYRKKKPAPQPPTKETLSPNHNLATSTHNSSPTHAATSPHTTPRLRKTKPAPPPPPLLTSTPQNESLSISVSCNESSIAELDHEVRKLNVWEDQKSNKNEMNRNRQSFTCVDNPPYGSYTDKSVQGKWKRKKGPAPPRPTPHRRKIKVMSMKDVKLELDEIEMQQQGLERQGVRLEQIIRDKTESKPMEEDSSLGGDVEELVLELFVLVNEKNELFRRQAELMLLRRQQRLEEEHADVEYQIRCLMCQPEATKTDFDKQREEALIQRLVQIVERRNEIVECLEMDRRREVEEDRSINKHMGLYAARSKIDPVSDNDANRPSKTKKSKLKDKFKEKKLKKSHKKDVDKDVDEAEVKLKRHTKRKWF